MVSQLAYKPEGRQFDTRVSEYSGSGKAKQQGNSEVHMIN